MKIAFISTILSYPWGGADTLWTRAAEAASARGDDLMICVSKMVAAHPRIQILKQRGAKIHVRHDQLNQPTLAFRVRRKFGFAPIADDSLIAGLHSFKPDLVIFSQGGTYDLVLYPKLIRWLRTQGIAYRLIANWQEENPKLDADHFKFIQENFPGADSINFVSTRNLRVTAQHLSLPLPNARVIQNPLRWTERDVAPWPALPELRLATISRLDESKGIQLLLAALALLRGGPISWRLNIYGLGPFEENLKQLTQKLRLTESVTFHGHVKELHRIWGDSHLMISPAIEDGVPMTIPEAMLCERPVLATRVGGAEDWITPGVNGFIATRPDVETLRATLSSAFAVHSNWQAMGKAAAASARAHYRPEDYQLLIS